MKRYIRANLNYVNSYFQEDSYQRTINDWGWGASSNLSKMLRIIDLALKWFPNCSMHTSANKEFYKHAGANGIVVVFSGPMSELQQDVCKIIKDVAASEEGQRISPKIIGDTVVYHPKNSTGGANRKTVTLTFSQVMTKSAQRYKDVYDLDVYTITAG